MCFSGQASHDHSNARMQIQAELGERHVNIIEAKEVMLTGAHLCLAMEVGAWRQSQHHRCCMQLRKNIFMAATALQN